MSNIIMSPRPHHHIVQNVEALFLGQYFSSQSSHRSFLSVVNEWLAVLCIFFFTTIVAELIWRW